MTAVATKIRRQGGAAVSTIPLPLLKLLHVEVGGQLTLSVANGELIARPLNAHCMRYTLSELLDGAEARAEIKAEVAWANVGGPVGRELL